MLVVQCMHDNLLKNHSFCWALHAKWCPSVKIVEENPSKTRPREEVIWRSRSKQTRLLGRPQTQMYPPVALNQYTLVNRTHNDVLHATCFKAHKHFKIDFTPKLSSQQHVKYGSNLNIFHNFVSIFGAYVESRGTKVSWRSHHTGDVCTTRNNNG